MNWLPEPKLEIEVTPWDLEREAQAFANLAEGAIENGGAPLLDNLGDCGTFEYE